jgi:hypothetical protein
MENVNEEHAYLKSVFKDNAPVDWREKQKIIDLYFKYMSGEEALPKDKWEYASVQYHAKNLLQEKSQLHYALYKPGDWAYTADHDYAFRIITTRNAFYGAQYLTPIFGFLKEVVGDDKE